MAEGRILVIEDNPLNMELVTDLLEVAGYSVFASPDAETGLSIADKEQPDIILMDISLPGTDGLKATQMLKQHPGTQAIPIIALTAHAMKGDEQRALDAGCAGYITKPIDTRGFAKVIEGYLQQHKH